MQVDQARQALFNGQSRLLAANSSFANRLDGYKLFLGLPPDVSMRVMDDYLESFRLTDLELVGLQEAVNRILSAVRNPEEVSTRSPYGLILMQTRKGQSYMETSERFRSFRKCYPNENWFPACENGLI